MKPFDHDGKFLPTELGGELRRRAVRGAGITVFSQGLVFVVQVVGTVVLARLLTPADFGVVTMVTTFSLLLVSFGLNGYTEAVIQREALDHRLASNLFWINVGVGLLFALAFSAAGSSMARFYHDPRVAQVAIGISLTIFLTNFSVIHLALLKRALCYSVTSANDVLAGVLSVLLMIALAWAGFGYWALVAGTVARPFFQCIGAFYLCRWIPSLPGRANGTGDVVRFAVHVYGRFTVNYCDRNLDNLLVGWQFGPASLGLYKKAYDLFVLPANQLLLPVQEVALSTLSRLNRESEQYRRYFLNGLSILTLIGMGMGAILTLEGKDLIRLLLGSRWDASARIFVFFGPGIGIMLVYNTIGLLHLSLGKADRWFRWVLVEFGVTGLLFLLGLRWGPAGVAAAWTVSFWILFIPAFWYAGRPIRFGVAPILATVWKYVAASLSAALASVVITRDLSSLQLALGVPGALLRIATISLLFTALYLTAVIILQGGPRQLYGFAELLLDILPYSKNRESVSRNQVELPSSAAGDSSESAIPEKIVRGPEKAQ
ncbi:MAG TPA: lipopolysaccharide biosynthesis protein [Candidatus Acidoferrum sp.]|nr:lipopolysaccharide biosynthesis protein [Candidatus Acidoferrum sp.]